MKKKAIDHDQLITSIRDLGPINAADLANLLDANLDGVRKRLKELMLQGLIIRHPKTSAHGCPTYTVTGTCQVTVDQQKPEITKINDVEYVRLSDAMSMVANTKIGRPAVGVTFKVVRVSEERNMNSHLLNVTVELPRDLDPFDIVRPGKMIQIGEA